MLKLMKRDEEKGELLKVEDERGVKRQVYYEDDDDAFIFATAPIGNGYHDDLDELDGILPDLDETLERCQITLERLQSRRTLALQEGRLALYLALETKVAQLSGYVQGLTFVREHLGNGVPKLEFEQGDDLVSLDDEGKAQAKLDEIVRRIEGLLTRRAKQENFN